MSSRMVAPWRAAERAAAAMTGLAFGFAAGLPLVTFDWGPAAAIAIAGMALLGLVRTLVPESAIAGVSRIVALAFAFRAAAAVLVYSVSTLAGRGGFVTGDDAGYAALAWGFAQYVKGTPEPPFTPPDWHGGAYMFGPFTYLEAAIFYVFGPRPLLVEVLNAAFGSASIVFIYRIARSTVGKPAAVLTSWMVAVYPSLVLWSALNLREGLAFLLTSAALWTLLESMRSPGPRSVVAAGTLVVAVWSIRGFAFAGVAAAALTAALLALRVRPARWRGFLPLAAALAAVTLAAATIWPDQLVQGPLRTMETYREAMAQEARTAFYRPPAFVGADGDTFVVFMRPTARALVVPFDPRGLPTYLGSTGSDLAGDPPAGTDTGAVIWVSPPVRVVLAGDGSEAPVTGTVPVSPGDLVVVGEAGRPPRPPAERRVLELNDLRGGRPAGRLEPSSYRPEEGVLERTVLHIPIGLAYVLWSPFPFDLRRSADLFTMPEMLVWYAAFPAAAWTLTARRRWRGRALPVLVFVAVVISIFVAAEGNTGILFRHRAMLVPYVLAFAAPGSLAVARAVAMRIRGARAAHPQTA